VWLFDLRMLRKPCIIAAELFVVSVLLLGRSVAALAAVPRVRPNEPVREGDAIMEYLPTARSWPCYPKQDAYLVRDRGSCGPVTWGRSTQNTSYPVEPADDDAHQRGARGAEEDAAENVARIG